VDELFGAQQITASEHVSERFASIGAPAKDLDIATQNNHRRCSGADDLSSQFNI
jgi:hypothetical protein